MLQYSVIVVTILLSKKNDQKPVYQRLEIYVIPLLWHHLIESDSSSDGKIDLETVVSHLKVNAPP